MESPSPLVSPVYKEHEKRKYLFYANKIKMPFSCFSNKKSEPVTLTGTLYPKKSKSRKVSFGTQTDRTDKLEKRQISQVEADKFNNDMVRTYKKKRTYGGNSQAMVKGHGDYAVYYKGKKQNTPFASVGKHIGNYFGAPGIGWSAGHLIGRILGSGDYISGPGPLSNNTLVNKHEIPKFATTKISNVVCHREYIKDITTSSVAGQFNLEGFTLNPGLANTFPWLSSIAENYEEYKIHGMLFEFKTMSSDALNSTNTALGTVIMSTSYNVLNADFPNKQAMENYEYSQSAKPSVSQLHGIECARGQNPLSQLYVRTGDPNVDDDMRMYDLGRFQIATQGFQGTSVNVGELWVTYCVEFFKPKLPSTVGGSIDSSHLQRTNTDWASSGAASPVGLIGLSTSGTVQAASSGTGDAVTYSNLVVGNKYVVLASWTLKGGSGGSPSIVAPAVASATNSTPLAINAQGTVSSAGSSIANSATASTYYMFIPTASTVTVTFNTNGTFTPRNSGTIVADIYLTPLDSSITTST